MPMLHIYSKFSWVQAPEKEVYISEWFPIQWWKNKMEFILKLFQGCTNVCSNAKKLFCLWCGLDKVPTAICYSREENCKQELSTRTSTKVRCHRWMKKVRIQFHHKFTYGEINYDPVPCPCYFAGFLLKIQINTL